MSNTALAYKWILEVKLEQIKKWLEENERSQAWLARQSDISPENLNGHVEPKFSTMEKIDEVIK